MIDLISKPALMLTEKIYEILLQKLILFSPISHAFKIELKRKITLKKFLKGQKILITRHRVNKLWFLIEGFAKETGFDDEFERTTWFFFENDFIFAYPSFFSQLPAFRDVAMITDGTVLEITYNDLILLRKKFEELVIIMDMARDLCEQDRARYAARMHSLSAQERYNRFYNEHKALFNIAKHKDITSFLGIKSDSFSRFYTND